jgi:magnesium chelatase subunit D
VARDGVAGRARARDDALAAARGLRSGGVAAVVIDTSPTQRPQAQELAQEMGAHYLAMPHANAASVSRAVRGQLADARPGA